MYDYYLGGSHSFAADREAVEQVVKAVPNVRQIAVAGRDPDRVCKWQTHFLGCGGPRVEPSPLAGFSGSVLPGNGRS